jgi:phosphoribosyl-ATP pyrophosphohydrolase/phosphoribosyl-AMP cyclohydrolase
MQVDFARQLDFDKLDGLLPAVVQDVSTREILMVGFMNQEAWEKTYRTGHVTFWSRTRSTLWTKGETSGNYLVARRIRTDCDGDTLLIEAEPRGPTCHTGAYSCFFNEIPFGLAADSRPADAPEGDRA